VHSKAFRDSTAVCCHAVGPIAATAQGLCLPGALSYIGCYIDRQGYLADVSYYSRSGEEEITVCSSTPQQLSQAQLASVVRSVGEVITSIQVCSDSGGVRGLKLQTSLDQSYTCGQTSGSCSSLSGSGAALTGFGAVCGSAGALLRVQSINSPCWNRNYVQPTSPASKCHFSRDTSSEQVVNKQQTMAPTSATRHNARTCIASNS
jgi:hypothetical protein